MRNCVSNSTLVSSIVRPSILSKWDEGVSRTQRVASGSVLGAHWTQLREVVRQPGDDGGDGNSCNQENCATDIFIGGCHSFLIGRGGK